MTGVVPPTVADNGMHVLVMAKAPVAGLVKTRLTPALSPAQAAEVAQASLADTFDAVLRCGADRKVVALDGSPGAWVPEGLRVIEQRGKTFDERIANAWSDSSGPGLQIGMDTPQVTPQLLDDALATLADDRVDAVLGMAEDGGWWAIGLIRPDPRVFMGIEMSRSDTGLRQLDRLHELGLRTAMLPVLRDVDTVADLVPVSAAAPGTRFAAICSSLPALALTPTGGQG